MLSYISYFPDRKRGFLEKQFLDELLLWIMNIMPGYFPLSIPPSPPSINIISEISYFIIRAQSREFYYYRKTTVYL